MVRRGLVTGFCLLLALFTVAPPAAAQAPKRGGVLRIAEREAPNLDPQNAVSASTVAVART